MKKYSQKIALFGTSADPPTNGHKIIIEELAKIYNFVISYASNNPNKKHKENLFSRSILLKTLIEDFKNPKIYFDQDLTSPWAITTIKTCKKKYNFVDIDFVIGSDLLNELTMWKNINELFKEVALYIVPREGHPIDLQTLKIIKKNHGNFKISTFNVPNISSSVIRESKDYSGLPECIISLIEKKNLYNFLN